MAVDQVVLANPVSVKEVLALARDFAADPLTVRKLIPSIPLLLDSTTTPPVTTVWTDNVALSAGAATLDLELLLKDDLPSAIFTGLKVQVLVVSCPQVNTGAITMTPGASNGYDLGGASMSVAVNPGDTLVFFFLDTAPDVAAADSELDFAGTGSETFDILMVAG